MATPVGWYCGWCYDSAPQGVPGVPVLDCADVFYRIGLPPKTHGIFILSACVVLLPGNPVVCVCSRVDRGLARKLHMTSQVRRPGPRQETFMQRCVSASRSRCECSQAFVLRFAPLAGTRTQNSSDRNPCFRMGRKIRSDPLVPAGCAATAGVLGGGLMSKYV